MASLVLTPWKELDALVANAAPGTSEAPARHEAVVADLKALAARGGVGRFTPDPEDAPGK